MYLSATFDLPNGGTATVGRVAGIQTSADATTTSILISYYSDITNTLVMWQGSYDVPGTVLSSGTYPDNIYTWLVSGSGPLSGATMLNDTQADVDDARAAKWVEVKAYRDASEFGGCDTPQGIVDSDEVSQTRVTSTLSFADLIGTSFGVGWTMQDNSVVWFDYADFQNLALLMGQHVSNAHSRAQSLRDRLNALTTITDVENFDVIAEWASLALEDETGAILLTEAGIDLVA